MAVSISELVKVGTFDTAVEGGESVTLALPTWFPRGFDAAALEAQVARHGVGAVMAMFTAQAVIDLRARVRMGKRTSRTTKAGVEVLVPLSDETLTENVERVVFGAPSDSTERKLAGAAKALAGLTPEQIAGLLASLGQ